MSLLFVVAHVLAIGVQKSPSNSFYPPRLPPSIQSLPTLLSSFLCFLCSYLSLTFLLLFVLYIYLCYSHCPPLHSVSLSPSLTLSVSILSPLFIFSVLTRRVFHSNSWTGCPIQLPNHYTIAALILSTLFIHAHVHSTVHPCMHTLHASHTYKFDLQGPCKTDTVTKMAHSIHRATCDTMTHDAHTHTHTHRTHNLTWAERYGQSPY